MESVVRETVNAVPLDDPTLADVWVDLIREEYQALSESGGGADWPQFKEVFVPRAKESFDGDTVDRFVEHLDADAGSAMGVIAQLADPNLRDELVRSYAAAGDGHGVAGDEYATGHDDHVAADASGWMDYVRERVQGWDGTDTGGDHSWDNVVYWMKEQAPAGFRAEVDGFAQYVESRPSKVDALAEYGFTVPALAGAGTTAPQVVEPAAVQPDDDEVDLGAAMAALFDSDAVVDDAHSTAQKAAGDLADAGQVPPEFAIELPSAFREVLAEMPEAAELTEEEIRELFVELAQETEQVQA